MQGTMPGAQRQGRPRMAWVDNINTWTRLLMKESIRMTEINGESTSMVWPTLALRSANEQNGSLLLRTYLNVVRTYWHSLAGCMFVKLTSVMWLG